MIWIIKNNKKKVQKKEYPSLFEVFHLGDRVKRTIVDKDGNTDEFSGIIMAIYNDSIDIFWDTVNNKYSPQEIDNLFNNITINDIFNGSDRFSPVKKDRYIFKNIIKL